MSGILETIRSQKRKEKIFSCSFIKYLWASCLELTDFQRICFRCSSKIIEVFCSPLYQYKGHIITYFHQSGYYIISDKTVIALPRSPSELRKARDPCLFSVAYTTFIFPCLISLLTLFSFSFSHVVVYLQGVIFTGSNRVIFICYDLELILVFKLIYCINNNYSFFHSCYEKDMFPYLGYYE